MNIRVNDPTAELWSFGYQNAPVRVENELIGKHRIPVYVQVPEISAPGQPSKIISESGVPEFVGYRTQVQADFRVPVGTVVGLVLTVGRSVEERKEIVRTLIDSQKDGVFKVDSSLIHALDMGSDILVLSDDLPYKSWGRNLKPEGTKKQFAQRLEKYFGGKIADLGLPDLIQHVFADRENRVLKVERM